MTNDKAREYFSAYAEGTLDAGLAHSFEAKLKADASLRADYDEFATLLKELDGLRNEAIEIPFDLNERISAAIDKDIYDRKQTAKPAWFTWVRNLGVAGLAAAALYGAYISINSPATKGVSEGGAVSGPKLEKPAARPGFVEQIEYKKTDKGVQMFFQPSTGHKVEVAGGEDGVNAYTADSSGWYNSLNNSQPNAAVFVVKVQGEVLSTLVVVPGTERRNIQAANGSLTELAKAVADQFGVPVVVRTAQADAEFAWSVADDAEKTLTNSLNNPAFNVSMMGEVVHVESN